MLLLLNTNYQIINLTPLLFKEEVGVSCMNLKSTFQYANIFNFDVEQKCTYQLSWIFVNGSLCNHVLLSLYFLNQILMSIVMYLPEVTRNTVLNERSISDSYDRCISHVNKNWSNRCIPRMHQSSYMRHLLLT